MASSNSDSAVSPFGRKLRKDFFFDNDYININHGSYGTYPKPVRDALRRWQDLAEARPDQYVRYDYQAALCRSRALVAEFLHAPYETCVFVLNVTTGVNVVLRNLVYEEGDVIVTFATTYGACAKAATYVGETTKARTVTVEYTYPIEDDDLVQKFVDIVKSEQDAGRRVKVALFDVLVSGPGVRMPYEKLTQACRELGVLSLIDGAHAIGQVDLNLGELDPDFFLSNCHKQVLSPSWTMWLLTPRACAVFYCPLRNQALMRSTLPTSWGFRPLSSLDGPQTSVTPSDEASHFAANFSYVGAGDFSPYLCVSAALEYRASLGGEVAIREYCGTLAREGGNRAAEILGTEVLDNATGTMTKCFMVNVRLPLSLSVLEEAAARAGPERERAGKQMIRKEDVAAMAIDWVGRVTVKEYNGFQAVLLHGGKWWARLSAMVYLEMADFEWAAGVLKKVCERAENGDWIG